MKVGGFRCGLSGTTLSEAKGVALGAMATALRGHVGTSNPLHMPTLLRDVGMAHLDEIHAQPVGLGVPPISTYFCDTHSGRECALFTNSALHRR